jgi:surfeit locus 1 family protein
MKRFPIVAAAIVALAVAAMIALGIWQLRRASWKTGLIATYQANLHKPAIPWPALLPKDDSELLYRRATGFCVQPVGWRDVVGHNPKGEPGWSHIASCRTNGAEGPGMEVDIGWSVAPKYRDWKGGAVAGLIVPDHKHRIRLVADTPAPGLQPSTPTSPADVPNNHFAYAIQWFLFALTGAIIFLVAVRRRRAEPPASG